MSNFLEEAEDEQKHGAPAAVLFLVSPLRCTQPYASLSSSPFGLISLLKASRPTLVCPVPGPLLT